MMLKYLGERGGDAPIRAAISVSAPLSLKATQLRIMERRNRVYHNYLLLGMKNYMKQMKDHYDQNFLAKAQAAKTLFEFDDHVTARANGMVGAEEYYRLHSAEGFVGNIAIPTLLIHAQNDPWIPVADYGKQEWPEEGWLSLLMVDDGGHVGFHSKGHKVPWHERVAANYFQDILAT